MIRLTALFARKSAVAVQPVSVESLWLAASPLGSAAATASTLRGWSKTLSAASLFSVCVCATSTASAQWTITDVGTLPGGSLGFSYANSINNAGQVVGSSSSATGTRAFLWQNGVMTNLGDLPGGADNSVATSINNSGQVVGYSDASGNRAFLWQSGVMTDLGTLAGEFQSNAYGINDSGQVVGGSSVTIGTGGPAFLWQSGVMTNLGTLPGGGDYSDARGINNAGQVVGASNSATGDRAFLWQNFVMTDLGSLTGDSSGNSAAYGINNAGQVVGASLAATGYRAFMWQNGVMTDLGDLPGGGYSAARGINNAGQVVGYTGTVAGQSAFLWQDGVMTDLSAVSGVAGTGWTLAEAAAINDVGQIVGNGTNPQRLQHAFILTPVPEPEVYLMMGVGVCLAGVIARRRKQISR